MKAFSTHFPKGDTQTILKTLGTVDPAEAELAKSISHAIWNTEMAQAKRNMILEMIVAGAQQQNPDINFIKLKIYAQFEQTGGHEVFQSAIASVLSPPSTLPIIIKWTVSGMDPAPKANPKNTLAPKTSSSANISNISAFSISK